MVFTANLHTVDAKAGRGSGKASVVQLLHRVVWARVLCQTGQVLLWQVCLQVFKKNWVVETLPCNRAKNPYTRSVS